MATNNGNKNDNKKSNNIDHRRRQEDPQHRRHNISKREYGGGSNSNHNNNGCLLYTILCLSVIVSVGLIRISTYITTHDNFLYYHYYEGFSQGPILTPQEAVAATMASALTGEDRKTPDNKKNLYSVFDDFSNKPWFLLHIGPPKTATSSLQEGLIQYSDRLAQHDNVYFLGGGGGRGRRKGDVMPNGEILPCTFCLMGALQQGFAMNATSNQEVQKFRARIRHHLELNHNVLFSAEQLGSWFQPFNFETLETLLYWNEFNVRVALTYRHFIDWLPSKYYQDFQHEAQNNPGILALLQDKLDKIVATYDHDDDVGKSESSNTTQDQRILLSQEPFSNHWSIPTLYQQWSQRYGQDNVMVFDLHQTTTAATGDSSSLVADWICQMLLPLSSLSAPSSSQFLDSNSNETTCAFLRAKQARAVNTDNDATAARGATAKKHRESALLHVPRVISQVRNSMIESGDLMVERQDRWSDEEENRIFSIVERLMEKKGLLMNERMNSSIYYQCIPSSTEAILLNVSLAFASQLRELQGIQLNESERRQSIRKQMALYNTNKANGKYCDILPGRVLQDFPDLGREIRKWLWRLAAIVKPSAAKVAKSIGAEMEISESTNSTHHVLFSKTEQSWYDQYREPPDIIPSLPLPILVVNMPKSGTKTIEAYFNCGMGEGKGGKGSWVNHHLSKDLDGNSVAVAQIMHQNVQSDKPLLEGTGRFAVYTDDGLMWRDKESGKSLCFYPGVHALDNFAEYYPHGTILHLPRNTSQWISSSRGWGGDILSQYDRDCGAFQPGIESKTTLTSDNDWATWYEQTYTQGIRKFAKAHSTLTYVESSLEDVNATGELLEKVSGIPAMCFGHKHKTADVRARIAKRQEMRAQKKAAAAAK